MGNQDIRRFNWMKNNPTPTRTPNPTGVNISPLEKQILKLKQFDTNLTRHLETSNNTFSIDNVNTINKEYIKVVNKLNFTLNAITQYADEIIAANDYAFILRPIFEKKFTDNAVSINGYVTITKIEPYPRYAYLWEPVQANDNKYQLLDPLLAIQRKDADIMDQFNKLREKYPEQSMFYVINWYKWADSVKVTFNICIPDILNPDGPWIRILAGVNITPYFPSITSVDLLPQTYKTYLQQMENAFNTFSKKDYDSTLGTIYQFGEDKNFHILKVVSSPEYPSWDNQFIVNSYIPGSNINMPEQIFMINTELNRNYTGMHVDEIVIVNYVVGSIYYTGVIKMLEIPEYITEYSELCYQIISININEIFQQSVKITGDTEIQGNLQVLKYNGESVIETDNTRKITTFHDKVGINQQSHEVEGLLDIDNLTHQVILDLFDTFIPYSLNSYDVMQTIIAIDPYADSKIGPLFLSGNPLFDYTNQVDVISVPIKPIILEVDILKLHTTDIATPILQSTEFLKQLGQIVKEVNQMSPEIEKANDPDFIFSFIMLVSDINKKWYILSLRAIIRGEDLIFTITHFDITYLMVDESYKQMLLHIYDYVSREFRYINLVCLLLKDPNLYDVDKYLIIEMYELKIRNNEYFSNKFDLLPESYVFDVRVEEYRYEYIGANLSWTGQYVANCWNKDASVVVVVDSITYQTDQLYNNRTNSVFPVNYIWQASRKLSFVNRLIINDILYVIGSGVSLNTLLSQSLLVRGDNTISGNFYVADSNNNNIFKVDNVEKTITNSYKVGIGMDYPESILHIKDTTVQDVLDEMDAAIMQSNLLNNLVRILKDATSEDQFGNIIEAYVGGQTIDHFYAMYRVDLNTFRSEDMTVMYHWYFSGWEDKVLKDIVDYENNGTKKIIINYFNEILNDYLIFDTALFAKIVRYIWGEKRGRGRFVFINKNLYIIATGTNILKNNLRINTNSNIGTLMVTRDTLVAMVSDMYRQYMYLSAYNVQESLNKLNMLMHKNKLIKKNIFKIKISISEIKLTTVSDIDFDTRETGNEKTLDDMDANNRNKYMTFWSNLTDNNTIINVGFEILVKYQDLDVDYYGACKCVNEERDVQQTLPNGDEVISDVVTLLCVEFRIQDCIIPSLNVEGDARVIGDLLVTDQTTNENYVSIDPIQKFFGVNTDERFINYQDIECTTCDNLYTSQHNVYVKSKSYPVMVCERIREDQDKEPENNLSEFGTYSAFTIKRKSERYTFNKIGQYAAALDTDFRTKNSSDTVTHMRYGPDLSFEVCDKTNRSVELGQLQLTIDSIDPETGYLKCGFGVQVNDFKKGEAFENVRRDLLYVNNESTLFIKQINLNGGILSTDASGNLLWNGFKLVTE